MNAIEMCVLSTSDNHVLRKIMEATSQGYCHITVPYLTTSEKEWLEERHYMVKFVEDHYVVNWNYRGDAILRHRVVKDGIPLGLARYDWNSALAEVANGMATPGEVLALWGMDRDNEEFLDCFGVFK